MTAADEHDYVFHRDGSRRLPVIARGEGVYLYDTGGNRYLDATGGPVVVSVGHGVPEILDAIAEQARAITYVYGLPFTTEPELRLAEKLSSFAPGELDYSFFVSGGSEATETAIKLARRYFLARGEPARWKVIGRWRSYHGNTLATLSASGHVLRRRHYGPYLLPFPHIAPPYRYRCQLCAGRRGCTLACADELEQCILQENPEEVAAFILEPVTGSSVPGLVPPDDYLPRIREICDRYGILLIADEVLCGAGRTGRNFAVDHWNVVPDVLVCGKGLSSGYAPLGAVVVTDRIFRTIRENSKDVEPGFTYGGNPLACATGLAVLRYIEDHHLIERAAELGEYLLAQLRGALEGHPIVGEVAGLGLLAGVELVADRETRTPFPRAAGLSRRIVDACLERGVVILGGSGGQANGIDGDRLELAPPFVIERSEIDRVVSTLLDALDSVTSGAHAPQRSLEEV